MSQTPPTGFQYMFLSYKDGDSLLTLNHLAQDGWRVTTSTPYQDGIWLLLEKPLPGPTG
jgi:hypothetical protein